MSESKTNQDEKSKVNAAERARVIKACGEIKANMDYLVRLAVAKVDSDEIHDFDVAIGNYIADCILAKLEGV